MNKRFVGVFSRSKKALLALGLLAGATAAKADFATDLAGAIASFKTDASAHGGAIAAALIVVVLLFLMFRKVISMGRG